MHECGHARTTHNPGTKHGRQRSSQGRNIGEGELPEKTQFENRIHAQFQLCMGHVHEVQVDIRAAYLMLPNDDAPTSCRNYDESDESEFDCRSRCRMEMIRVSLVNLQIRFCKFYNFCLARILNLHFLV